MNKYANLVGTNKIKDEYTKINTGFDGVETDIDALNDLVDALDSRVDTIITTPISGEAAAQEIVDARASAVKSKTFATLDARFEETEQDVESHMADNVTDADGAHGLKIEQGTWTPSLSGDSGTYNHTYAIQYGYYYKIGKLVHIVCQIALSAKDPAMAGGLNIAGLPFVPYTHSSHRIGNLIVSENVNQDNLVGSVLPNNPKIRLNAININGLLGTPTAAIIFDTSKLFINATYPTEIN